MKTFPFFALSAGAALGLTGCGASSSGLTTSGFGTNQSIAVPTMEPHARKVSTGAGTSAAPAVIPPVLDDYIAKVDPSYKWEITARPDNKTGAGVYEMQLTSQTWHETRWTHHVQIFRPEKIEFPGKALLSVSYGHGTVQETFYGQIVANATGAYFVNVFDVPNQPLFDAREDGLIALTFDKAIKNNDPTWPLLLPMTKSAVQAMNAVGEFSKKELGTPLDKFAVTGASKRGWTTYLVGAAEAKAHPGRVIGIAPFVYDNLNIPAQLQHQHATWGEYSPKIVDYTQRDLPQKMISADGQKLVSVVDPYTYRERLAMPKLLVDATNDEYWNLDGYDFFGQDLPGQTVRYEAPNVGHIMRGQEARAAGTMGQWFRLIAAGQPVPALTMSVNAQKQVSLQVKGAPATAKLRFWTASSPTRDFRKAEWKAVPATASTVNGALTALSPLPTATTSQPCVAIFGEVEVPGQPLPLVLSTPVQVFGPKPKEATTKTLQAPKGAAKQQQITVSVPPVTDLQTGAPQGDTVQAAAPRTDAP